jgi:hypothetical protein
MPDWAMLLFLAVVMSIVFLGIRALIRAGDRKPSLVNATASHG